ncbi:MAG: hypothetical protein AAB608_00890 [Patescibacteria group bacterium]
MTASDRCACALGHEVLFRAQEAKGGILVLTKEAISLFGPGIQYARTRGWVCVSGGWASCVRRHGTPMLSRTIPCGLRVTTLGVRRLQEFQARRCICEPKL